MKQIKLMLGDNIESLKKLPDNSIDSVVTDPPYGLKFMGKKWDYSVPTKEFWEEVYRVLKPGGHVLSFGGTRTYHRMVVNLEDGGFEIRDCISWIYGSGFPKSLNIGKAIQKLDGPLEVIGKKIQRVDGTLRNLQPNGGFMKDNVVTKNSDGYIDIVKIDNEYEGWGTALKPAQEIICVARKPISEKTIAENVLKWGCAGLNIDESRIGTETISIHNAPKGTFAGGEPDRGSDTNSYKDSEGRFPANVIFDEEAGQMLDDMSGVTKTNCKAGTDINTEVKGGSAFPTSGYKKATIQSTINDKGGASRFFYSAKVSKAERNMGLDGFEEVEGENNKTKFVGEYWEDRGKLGEDGKFNPYLGPTSGIRKNTHPCLKPITLMSYLIKLVTPVNGIILDPFMGSGSTGIAAQLNGFRFCGMELDPEYYKIAEARINNFEMYRKFLDKKKKK